MFIFKGGQFHQAAAWQLHAMRLKRRGSYPTCKIENEYLNVCEWVEVVERNEDGSPPSPAVL